VKSLVYVIFVEGNLQRIGTLVDIREFTKATSPSNVAFVVKDSHEVGILWVIREYILVNILSYVTIVIKGSLKKVVF
jgi:hypothetical protein